MESPAAFEALKMVCSRSIESHDLFKGCALEAKSQACSLYLSFLADKKSSQVAILQSIGSAYGFQVEADSTTIHQRFLRYEHELVASALSGVYETVFALSDDDISHFSTMLAFEDDKKIRSIYSAAIDYERDFIIDAWRGYLKTLEIVLSRETVEKMDGLLVNGVDGVSGTREREHAGAHADRW